MAENHDVNKTKLYTAIGLVFYAFYPIGIALGVFSFLDVYDAGMPSSLKEVFLYALILLPFLFVFDGLYVAFSIAAYYYGYRKIGKGNYAQASHYLFCLSVFGLVPIHTFLMKEALDLPGSLLLFSIPSILGSILFLVARRNLQTALKRAHPSLITPTPTPKTASMRGTTGHRFCSSCGQAVDPNNKFCEHCGAKLSR